MVPKLLVDGIDADADIGQHRLVEDEAGEVQHRGDQHDVHDVGQDVARA